MFKKNVQIEQKITYSYVPTTVIKHLFWATFAAGAAEGNPHPGLIASRVVSAMPVVVCLHPLEAGAEVELYVQETHRCTFLWRAKRGGRVRRPKPSAGVQI